MPFMGALGGAMRGMKSSAVRGPQGSQRQPPMMGGGQMNNQQSGGLGPSQNSGMFQNLMQKLPQIGQQMLGPAQQMGPAGIASKETIARNKQQSMMQDPQHQRNMKTRDQIIKSGGTLGPEAEKLYGSTSGQLPGGPVQGPMSEQPQGPSEMNELPQQMSFRDMMNQYRQPQMSNQFGNQMQDPRAQQAMENQRQQAMQQYQQGGQQFGGGMYGSQLPQMGAGSPDGVAMRRMGGMMPSFMQGMYSNRM